MIPFGKGRTVLSCSEEALDEGMTCGVVTYGMGVYWALNAAKRLEGQVEIFDLRTLSPYDQEGVYDLTKRHGKILVLTEETITNSFAEALAGRISRDCFRYLDAPVQTLGSEDIPAVPLNMGMEAVMLPNVEKTYQVLKDLLDS